MSSFTAPLFHTDTGKTRNGRPVYRLTAAFTYDVGCEGSNLSITAPEGFETDFASIPRLLRTLCPPNGPWAKAAVIHDALYETGEISRWISDRIFFEAMGVLKVNLLTRLVMYIAVRAFGWRSFGKTATSLPDWHYDAKSGWLAITHNGRITWDELQKIKNDAAGPSSRFIEVYPPEIDIVNKANVRHLWRVDNDFGLPDLKLVSACGRDWQGWRGFTGGHPDD